MDSNYNYSLKMEDVSEIGGIMEVLDFGGYEQMVFITFSHINLTLEGTSLSNLLESLLGNL